MPAQRNNRPITELFTGFDKTLRHYLIDRPRAYFETTRRKLRDLPRTNFALGCDFAERGLLLDAIFRFKLALWMQPNFPQALYNLGYCQMRVGRKNEARRALQKSPRAEARPWRRDLHALRARPQRGRAAIAADAHAGRHGGAVLHPPGADLRRYRAPEPVPGPAPLLFDAIKPLVRTAELTLVDIGCGTGLVSRPWRALARQIIGVDITPAMVDMARGVQVNERPLFERLLAVDILTMPDEALPAHEADIVLCSDTAQFLGDLAPLFARVSHLLKPGGVFALTVEPMAAPAGVAINPETARFGHHPDYVKRLAAGAGMEARRDGRINLYTNMVVHLFLFTAKAG